MRLLFYLLLPGLSNASDHGLPSKTIQIFLGGKDKYDDDEESNLQIFSKILLNLKKDASGDALRTGLPIKWFDTLAYDTVNPFGDYRQGDFDGLWTFDISKDVLLYTNHHQCSQISLATIRARAVTIADVKVFGPPVPLPKNPTLNLTAPFWRPQMQIDERLRAFTRRTLCDFNFQWRHILRGSFNTVTLRVLARAIIRLLVLDFDIREETSRRHGLRGPHVWITELPKWDSLDGDVVRVGDVYVVVCCSLQQGVYKTQDHAASQMCKLADEHARTRLDYVILSVKHVMLCYAEGSDRLYYTAPERLFNGEYGTGPPSSLALDYLIWATASAVATVLTPFQQLSGHAQNTIRQLPVEVHDIILSHVSAGTVAAARIGCVLGIGTPFSWTDGPLDIVLEDRIRNRSPWSPVESQIWFDDVKVGIVYKGQDKEIGI